MLGRAQFGDLFFVPIDLPLLLKAYASGIFPMADRRDDPDSFWVEPRDRAILPLDGLREVYLLRADAGLRAGLTQADVATGDSDPVWLVDPNGFVVLRYAPGFDPGDLRTDLARLLKIN